MNTIKKQAPSEDIASAQVMPWESFYATSLAFAWQRLSYRRAIILHCCINLRSSRVNLKDKSSL